MLKCSGAFESPSSHPYSFRPRVSPEAVSCGCGLGCVNVAAAVGVRDFKVQECRNALLPGGIKLKYSFIPRKLSYVVHILWTHSGFQGDIVVENSSAIAGDAKDVGLISGSGRSPEGASGNLL